MNKYYLGIDLGSTTSKAVIINEKDEIIGRGITNTRANYKVAADIAREEAIYDARFNLLANRIREEMELKPEFKKYMADIRAVFQYRQFKRRMDRLEVLLRKTVSEFTSKNKSDIAEKLDEILETIRPRIRHGFINEDLGAKNQFFRDIVSEQYNAEVAKKGAGFYEPLMLAFDKSITPVENEMVQYNFRELVFESMDVLDEKYRGLADQPQDDNREDWYYAELNAVKNNYKSVEHSLREHIEDIVNEDIHIAKMVGTGYGRALLPFPEDCIKSEILCHAFGAHAVFPNTRTVLDIGGQDTKAIQVDSHGLVTSFHMNDRCAAGCGRYLGYIADEFGLSLNELGPEAMNATKETTICSTCTVFAGAEVKELLHNGEERPNILAGLHKAIVQRAMSLIARSGGVKNEFTFTGGVARNQAVLRYVKQMVTDAYGEVTMNIHPDSIFMGALGGAMFARRNISADLPKTAKMTENEEPATV
ncbi:MAG: benzoyl-CoA reductase subunit A [Haliscomenobacteraceae bacterium CHB4]|nr:Benzoyl-CoA reductase subunit A [Saprospiraceae bacterium]MCE7924579.1 benzoyl-CoA reductase subunit A [Haliscomenobacteraceae bacterium CHB4]